MIITLDSLKTRFRNIHIVGAAAIEGAAIARFLHELGCETVTLHDFCDQKDFFKRFLTFHNGVENRAELLQVMRSLPYQSRFAEHYLEGIGEADMIFLPQAWYKYQFNYPVLADIVAAGQVRTANMMDLYLNLFPGKIIGVTGTHGKTTVTRLLAHCLQTVFPQVFLSGNERHSDQILTKLAHPETITSDSILILEISNRHLKQHYERSPNIAIITNIYPNHLDEHASLAEYRETKQKIAQHQKRGDLLVVGAGDPELEHWAKEHQGLIVDNAADQALLARTELPVTLPGQHNVRNAALVWAVLQSLGVSEQRFYTALGSFPGVEKRLQRVYQNDRVSFINDLASTTPQATLQAVLAFADHPLIVILGGDDKDIPVAEWQELARSLEGKVVILLPGTVRQRLPLANLHYAESENWLSALALVATLVAQQWSETKKATVVILSPAGEAFYTKFLTGVSLQKDLEKYLGE
ncbi:hypothetical protein KA517_05140 [Candidatus Gracilibacteria bacterium]|nr:hypothetical protein [Candidatus Gracilibacteria bacterium]